METSSGDIFNAKMPWALPEAPASARPLSVLYTWMLPSAMISAPLLTTAVTTRSQPRA
jgi:hypothetical protein